PLLRATQDGKAETGTLLWAALKNTDQRVEEEKSVTPAFLFAALLWQPVEERAAKYMEGDMTPLQALERAGDEVSGLQVRRTAIPRRFSAVTRQIWEIQARFTRTRGKRVYSVLRQPRFRAAYDFLLLRAEQDESLHPLAEFWTEAQKGQPAPAHHSRRKRRPRRRSRNRKPAAGNN
ncbi:MAG: polynucleotide adenylyltransferase PcnB, partial [Gammaproteobacteria bacterium]|nr:polynucleotide adenylyltransferase PcnB [Gammaproteobacteria bacterium]